MIDLVASKSCSGEIFLNKARQHLARHEWGQARMAIERGLSKGGLKNLREGQQLLDEVSRRLWDIPERASPATGPE